MAKQRIATRLAEVKNVEIKNYVRDTDLTGLKNGLAYRVDGVHLYIDILNIDEMLDILNKKSGVLGVSGVSSDFRDLEEAAEKGGAQAALAIDLFNYGVKKLIGAYAAAMGGVDAIVFTAGVGENSAEQRLDIASNLEFMGVKMDAEANKCRGKEQVISAADSRVKVLLIPTDEELMIARDTAALCR